MSEGTGGGGPTTTVDVLIAGGGMVGLTMAVALARGGLSVAVVERASLPSLLAAGADGRSTAIAAASRRALDALGLWAGIAPYACPIEQIRVSDGASPLFLHFDHHEVGDQPLGHIVENAPIRRALAAVAADTENLTFMAPAEITALARETMRVEATLNDGARLRAALLIGCDGRGSWVRRSAGIAVTRWAYPQTAIVCTVIHAEPHANIAHERFLPAGPFAILPMIDDSAGHHRSSLVWTERATLADGLLALDDGAFLYELARRFGDFLGPLSLTPGRWSYPLSLHHAERYVDHRLALVGDAAHGIHPIAGQGFNMGVRDMAALAEVVIEGVRTGLDPGDATLLRRFERWRRFDNTALLVVTDGLNRLFSTDAGPIRLARDLGLAGVGRVPALRRFFMRHAMGAVGKLPRLLRGEAL